MGRSKVIKVPFESLTADTSFNSRSDYEEEELEQLKESIKESGLLQHIGVTEAKGKSDTSFKKYYVVYGFRRFFAICKIREEMGEDAFSDIEVVLNEGTVEELRERNLKENIDRKNLKPSEIAVAIKHMVNSGLEQRDVAKRLGRPQSWVSYHYKAATKLNPTAWKAFSEGDMTLEQALNIADLSEESQTDIVNQVLGAETRTEARQIAKEASKEKGSRRKYSNKGKPTAKNITQYVSDASFDAISEVNSEEERSFYNGVVAGLRVALGDVEFEKVIPSEAYADQNYGKKEEKETKAKSKTQNGSAKKNKAKRAKKQPEQSQNATS